MQLTLKNLTQIKEANDLVVPSAQQLAYPEKVLQFGTGVLLRGLPDQIIDDANRKGFFGGRIVVVKSTSKGSTDSFEQQDGLYTVCFKGIEGGKQVNHSVVNSSISRVLSVATQWGEILRMAESPDLELIISNTTEVGIALTNDSIHQSEPPHSFPGKLLAVLHHRFIHFQADPSKGLIVVPTELIDDNGELLKEIILKISVANKLSTDFIQWLNECTHFCNSLVDRIVPGKMSDAEQRKQEEQLGYSDELMIMSEPFGFWAIESSSSLVKGKLSFAGLDATCIVAPSIKKFKEIKLRLLNGTHTFSCGIALLSGTALVRDAMSDSLLSRFIKNLLLEEIVPLVNSEEISIQEARDFANRVLDRFSNPFIDHKWESISAQFSSKMRMRNLPLMLKSVEVIGKLSVGMATGLAAFIICMNLKKENGHYMFNKGTTSFPFTDGLAERFVDHWKNPDTKTVVLSIISDIEIWGEDWKNKEQITAQVTTKIDSILQHGIRSVL